MAALGFHAVDPTGYGRLIMEGDRLVAIREDKECSPSERDIDVCNAGLMAFSGREALSLLTAIGNDVADAKRRAYEAVKCIRWNGAWCRKDISDKARQIV